MKENDITTNSIDYQSIWEDVKNVLINEVTLLTYEIWIKSLEPVGIRGDSIILKSQSEGGRSVVQNHHAEAINKAINQVTPLLKSFEIITESEMEQELYFDDSKEKEKKRTCKKSITLFKCFSAPIYF